MTRAKLAFLLLTASLLPGCTAETVLEDAPAVNLPHACTEPTKLFKNFLVRATKISWRQSRGKNASAVLAIDLLFDNTVKWPLALSNSGSGVVYSVDYSLYDQIGPIRAPTEATGIAAQAPLEKEPSEKPKPDMKQAPKINVHSRIQSGTPLPARLVFDVPRGDYLLAIERKFDGRAVGGNRADYISFCKISSADFASASNPASISGLH